MTDQEHLSRIVQNANGSAELIRRMVGQVADELEARGICPCALRLAGKLLVEQLWEASFAAEEEIDRVERLPQAAEWSGDMDATAN